MKVLKFGGSSVRDAERIKHAVKLVIAENKKEPVKGVVFSAYQGVTNDLIKISHLASDRNISYVDEFKKLKTRHINTATELLSPKYQAQVLPKLNDALDDLEEVLRGVYLIKELSTKILDFVQGFGEILSNLTITGLFHELGVEADFLDTRLVIKTDDNFGSAVVLFDETNALIKEYFKKHKKLQVITGFIASTLGSETTTLGRGGSDYTVSIIGAAINASIIEIWTDVDGVLTADPKKVRDAFPVKDMVYEEAIELSHFGARVIYPPTMQPVAQKKIPIVIKNTFNPSFPGTLIGVKSDSDYLIKGISSIDDINVIRVQGSGIVGMVGMATIAARVFQALAKENINIILITQASSERSICLAVLPEFAKLAKHALESEFYSELKTKIINEINVEGDCAVIAVVGKHMRKTPGISGKFFSALGDSKINITAIAQGSSELNISAVISKKDALRALNVIHHKFFSSSKSEVINLFLAGYGNVGSALVDLVQKNRDLYHRIRIHGVINSTKMVISDKEISVENLKKELHDSKVPSDLKAYAKKIKELNYPNSVFVDVTASELLPDIYLDVLRAGAHIVAANKKATTRDYTFYSKLKKTAEENNVRFLFETNVGAALPVISTMNDLIRAGDKITRIEGVLSGTLSFIFNNLSSTKKFSKLVKEAKELGYTEPDVREDLSGMDAARKILILIRESGHKFELSDLSVQNLVPTKYRKIASVADFMKRLPELDEYFDKRYADAKKKGCVLRYISSFENGKASVQLKEVDKKHPAYNLAGTENIIAYYTDYYNTAPQVVNGPGAGTQLTGVGIISDIFKIFG
jgi:bifunctional aspartokinase / homoserine dehydrogenase 1